MEPVSLSSMISALERGTKLHICVAFLGGWGNSKTQCPQAQKIHDRPVCLHFKQSGGLSSCYRCRQIVQRAVIRSRKPRSGCCVHGVYEYCRPVIYDGDVVCVIYIGNILPPDADRRRQLRAQLPPELMRTMAGGFSESDCARAADVLEGYITVLFDRYGAGTDHSEFLIENVKSHIRENQTGNVAVAELAALFGYTEKYMGQLFKRRTGQTIKKYCNELRIAEAKRLLADTDLSIASVAERVGFNTHAYFARVFRQACGDTPQAYRAAIAGDPHRAP